jgi:hypothetical protein
MELLECQKLKSLTQPPLSPDAYAVLELLSLAYSCACPPQSRGPANQQKFNRNSRAQNNHRYLKFLREICDDVIHSYTSRCRRTHR